MEQKGRQGLTLFLLTFVPPLLIVICYPGAYIRALNYAGIFCVVIAPTCFNSSLRKKFSSPFIVMGGSYISLNGSLFIICSILLLINSIWQLIY